jgi:spermidine/putrescine transport system permease protein
MAQLGTRPPEEMSDVGSGRDARLRSLRPGRFAPAFQLAPLLVVLGLLVVAPLGTFVVYSFWKLDNFQIVSDWNLGNYRQAITSDVYRSLFVNTLKIGAATAIVTVTVAYAFCHVLRFHLRQAQERVVLLVLVASFSGYLVRIYAWRTILGDQGIINTALQDIHVIHQPLSFLLFNRIAAVIVLSNFLLPVAVLMIYAGLQNIRDSEIEAARDLGAGAAATFLRVTLPLAWPAIFSAFALCFIIATGDYLTPLLVGGISGAMVGRAIADAFLAQYNWPLGAALSFVILTIVLAILAAVRLVGNRILR